MVDDIQAWIMAKHENLREIWKNSDEKQKHAIIWACVYTSLITTVWCAVMSIIF